MREEQISIATDDGETLAGTLLAPDAVSAVALLLPGSGPQDRDETISGQKPLRSLAEGLASRGVASLRCDDRGTGRSGGDYLAIDGDRLLRDVCLQADWLDARFGRPRLGLVGHSQGALFALRAARERSVVSRVVLLGGTVRPGFVMMMAMRERVAEDAGLTGMARASYLAHSRALFDAIACDEDDRARWDRVEALVRESVEGASDADFAPDFAGVEDYVSFAVADSMEWEVRELLLSDASSELARVGVPVLGVWGWLDRHLDPGAEREAFEAVCSGDCRAEVLDGMNHLFQRSETGAIERYGEDGDPMAGPVVGLVASWLCGGYSGDASA